MDGNNLDSPAEAEGLDGLEVDNMLAKQGFVRRLGAWVQATKVALVTPTARDRYDVSLIERPK